MKKIFTILFAAVLAANVWAQETPAIQGVSAQETDPGKLTIVWKADSTISKVYLVYLYAADITTQSITPIAFLAGYAQNFAIPGYPNYYGIVSATMLQLGQTYMTLKEMTGVQTETLAKFQAGWENNVDATDYTLNAGYYYITVTGYDAAGATITETAGYKLIQVNGKAQGIENIFESKKPVKFMENGQVRILRDGKVYDMSGTLVR